jgi:hypothetical protein
MGEPCALRVTSMYTKSELEMRYDLPSFFSGSKQILIKNRAIINAHTAVAILHRTRDLRNKTREQNSTKCRISFLQYFVYIPGSDLCNLLSKENLPPTPLPPQLKENLKRGCWLDSKFHTQTNTATKFTFHKTLEHLCHLTTGNNRNLGSLRRESVSCKHSI